MYRYSSRSTSQTCPNMPENILKNFWFFFLPKSKKNRYFFSKNFLKKFSKKNFENYFEFFFEFFCRYFFQWNFQQNFQQNFLNFFENLLFQFNHCGSFLFNQFSPRLRKFSEKSKIFDFCFWCKMVENILKPTLLKEFLRKN